MSVPHTPGPWRVSGDEVPECWIIENGEGDFIAQCEDRRGFVSLDGIVNARLIAAAPELLEALTVLADNIEHAFPALASLGPLTAARAAIAKATGAA